MVESRILFKGILEKFWVCHPISSFRESLEDSLEIEGRKGISSSQISIYHNSLVKVGVLALVFFFSMLIILESCI